ncbi:MAG: hypothetical protein ACJAT7_002389 [Psychromonas sp.]|jgi:hypothetical protein
MDVELFVFVEKLVRAVIMACRKPELFSVINRCALLKLTLLRLYRLIMLIAKLPFYGIITLSARFSRLLQLRCIVIFFN